ncbi:MAG: hypothetical protein AAB920_01135 [Patescibacteria group bacterium]
MKIAICGSMVFSKEMMEIKEKLEQFGHGVILPANTERYANGGKMLESKWAKIEGDLIRDYYNKIKECDAVLVANITKNGIENYVGGNAFIELAFGHVLNKKVYLINSVPEMNYKDEIEAMGPVILNGDLSKII